LNKLLEITVQSYWQAEHHTFHSRVMDITYSVVVQDHTATTEHTDGSAAALQSLKHVEITFLLMSFCRQRTWHHRVPDDDVRVRTHRDTTLHDIVVIQL